MAGVACPTCGSQDFLRHRQPVGVGDVTFRRHRCQNCKAIFQTAQVVVSGAIAEQILTLTEQPTTSSAQMLSDLGMSPKTLLQQMQDEDSPATTESRG